MSHFTLETDRTTNFGRRNEGHVDNFIRVASFVEKFMCGMEEFFMGLEGEVDLDHIE